MTIKQQGGVFGRHPTFSNADIDGPLTADSLATSGATTIGGALSASSARFPAGTYPASADAADLVIGSTSGNNGITIVSSASGQGLINFGDNGNIDAGQIKYRHDLTSMEIIVERQLRGTFNANGLAFPNGNGIDFSATSGTGTSELFDDYEEGTWTPTFSAEFTTPPTVTSAQYTKIGRQVTVTLLATGGVVTAGGSIGGLPFASNSAQGAGAYGGNSDTTESLQGTVGQSASSITNIPARTLTGDTWQITATYFT